ncbi:unnamed protein product, partial [Prunus brigantina]
MSSFENSESDEHYLEDTLEVNAHAGGGFNNGSGGSNTSNGQTQQKK